MLFIFSLQCTSFYSAIFRRKERCQVQNRCTSATVTFQPVGHNFISFVFEGRVSPAVRQQVARGRLFIVINHTAAAFGGI